jgi:hypothetical protein
VKSFNVLEWHQQIGIPFKRNYEQNKSGNTCYHALQILSSSLLLLKNVKNIQNYNFTCFILVWNLVSLIKGRTQIEGVPECLQEYLDLRGIQWQEAEENCTVSAIICTFHLTLLGLSNQGWSGRHGTNREDEECIQNFL